MTIAAISLNRCDIQSLSNHNRGKNISDQQAPDLFSLSDSIDLSAGDSGLDPGTYSYLRPLAVFEPTLTAPGHPANCWAPPETKQVEGEPTDYHNYWTPPGTKELESEPTDYHNCWTPPETKELESEPTDYHNYWTPPETKELESEPTDYQNYWTPPETKQLEDELTDYRTWTSFSGANQAALTQVFFNTQETRAT